MAGNWKRYLFGTSARIAQLAGVRRVGLSILCHRVSFLLCGGLGPLPLTMWPSSMVIKFWHGSSVLPVLWRQVLPGGHLLCFLTALLRYVHIQFTYLKYMIQWFLIYLQLYNHHCNLISRTFLWPPPKETLYPLVLNLSSFPPTAGNHQFTFYLYGFACSGHFTEMGSHKTCPSVSAFFHAAPCFQGSLCSSVCQCFISIYDQIIFYFMDGPIGLSIHLLMDTWAVSIFWLLRTVQLWIFMHNFLCWHVISLG